MANSSAKKIATENVKTLDNLRIGVLGVNAFYFLFRIVFYYSSFGFYHFLGYAITGGISVFLYLQLKAMGTPRYSPSGQLESSGEDLSAEGLTAYFFDIIYVTWFVHIGSVFTDYFWFFYLLIPGYAVIKLWSSVIKPYLGSQSAGEEPEMDEKTRKRLEKKQKKEGRVKYRNY
ncbi:DUF788-domain-containing protein [Basidiobolus meristosporus CBS 931.73]|uniref:DUF788-domain-containing protein n=1 Tax=Basidiobolus meristosporus CBS 931.73 TaxID=1314790 RepID=A0A1Y1YUC1_9FUNG|nr:DUF788-domain-containing protein [Basidiobolus meristosporus CBS 931.73]|eukprot:ORY01165.1 DUF788-domain-containing protein [Basidiobolus meristosporus CBS 931.73]